MTRAIQVQGLRYRYPDGTQALDGIDFHLDSGESVALFGANGSGKTTFVLHLNGLLRGEGSIEICGLPLTDDTLQDLRATPRFYWFPGMLTAVGLILGGYCLFSLSKLGTCLCPGCAASVELWDKFCYACDYKLPKQKKLVRI